MRRKLHPISAYLKGKRVLFVDDSIVRGTTSKEIVIMAREAGASEVRPVAPLITAAQILQMVIGLTVTMTVAARHSAERATAQASERAALATKSASPSDGCGPSM